MALFRFTSDSVNNLVALQREFERVFDRPLGLDLGVSGRGVFPAINIFRDKEGCVARLEIPGVPPEQISIESHGRTVTISGKREINAPSNGGFHRRDRSTGEFSRSVQLPDDLDPTHAEASYRHGILTLRIPRKEEAKPRQITVQAA